MGNPVPFAEHAPTPPTTAPTRADGYGVAGQLAVDAPIVHRENHLFVGADLGQSHVRFRSQSTVATLDDNRSTIDRGFSTPRPRSRSTAFTNELGLYASDTLSVLPDPFVTASLRLNVTTLSLEDQLGDDLTGDHSFHHLNPAIGASYQPRPWLSEPSASFSEFNRAPTAIELTCASPTDPCRLPNAFVADPPLEQVVAHTFEVGVRGTYRQDRLKLDYSAAAFQTTNTNDLIFISSGMVANQGYFSNVGDTRRQGIEAQLSGRRRFGDRTRTCSGRSRTRIRTRRSARRSRRSPRRTPTRSTASSTVPAGAHIPSIPKHIVKAGVTYVSAFGLSAGVNVIADSSQYFRGDEANLLPQVPGYVVVNARASYQIIAPVSVFVLANNLLQREILDLRCPRQRDGRPRPDLRQPAVPRPRRSARGVGRRRPSLLGRFSARGARRAAARSAPRPSP